MERFTIGFKHLLNGKAVKNGYFDFRTGYETPKEVYEECKELINEEKASGIYNELNGYYTIIDHLNGTHIYHIKAFKKEFNL